MEAKACNCLTQRKKLILANHEGKSYSEIAGIVQRSKSVVYDVIGRFKADKILEPKLTGLLWLPNGKIGWLKCF